MGLPLLIGGGLAQLAGGLFSGSEQAAAGRKAAQLAQFNPFAINGAGGSVFTGEDGALNVTPDQQMQMFQNLFGQQAQQGLINGFGQGAINFADQAGSRALGPTFADAIGASSDPTSALQAGNQFSGFAGGNALFGQQAGMNALGLAQQFGTQQTGVNEGVAQGLFGLGANALNNTDFSQLSADFVQRQRDFARPGEERAVNSKFQNLFNKGALSSTAGNRGIGELALQQEMADIQRVNAGEQFANMVQQQNRGFGLNAMNAGLGARMQDQRFNLGAGNLFSGMGQGMMTFGQNAAQQGFGAQLGLNELVNSRGQQRLLNTQNLLGFGGGLQNQNVNQSLGMFGALRGINADQRSLLGLSGQLGDMRAMAGARAGGFLVDNAFSPIGSALSGLGAGMAGFASGGMSGLADVVGG
jgi:hypothetical protein